MTIIAFIISLTKAKAFDRIIQILDCTHIGERDDESYTDKGCKSSGEEG